MSLRYIETSGFRNLKALTTEFSENTNFIYGSNGSGKTNLLELLILLCQGKSFLTRHLSNCIPFDQAQFTVFGQFKNYHCGIQRDLQETKIHLNSSSINRVSELALLTPVKIIDHNNFNLIDGSPDYRRQFIDWLMFHVEPAYHDAWTQLVHILKQRNSCLKQRQSLQILDHWDELLIHNTETVNKLRRNHLLKFRKFVEEQSAEIKVFADFQFKYYPGWNQENDYADVLKTQRDVDLKRGFTHSGLHRSDLKFTHKNRNSELVLSRGQKNYLHLC